MAEFPYLPFWTDAYLGDCGHLTDAEHGRYLQILLMLWRAPKQRIPNDLDWLARRFRRTVEQVLVEIIPVLQEFCKTDGNWWWQERLSKEWEWVEKKSAQRSDAAKSRWDKEKTPSKRNAGPHQSRNAPTPTPTPTPNTSTNVDVTPLPPSGFAEFWAAYPRKKGKPKAMKSWRNALKRAPPEQIMAGLARYGFSSDPKYIPHPTTWLNEDRWNDEPDPLSRREATLAALDALAERSREAADRVVSEGRPGTGLDERSHQPVGIVSALDVGPRAEHRPGGQAEILAVDPPASRMAGAGDPSRAGAVRSLIAGSLRVVS